MAQISGNQTAILALVERAMPGSRHAIRKRFRTMTVEHRKIVLATLLAATRGRR